VIAAEAVKAGAMVLRPVVEIDALAVYRLQIAHCCLLPTELVAGRSAIHLHRVAAANNQRASIHFAAVFAFPGAIAQLGERRAGSAKVGGSNPPSSISAVTPLA
jgi:hypothetical protein